MQEHSMRKVLLGVLLIAAVSTLGDFIWAGLHLRHGPLYGLSHGTLLFLCIGLYLGALAKQPYVGALAGAVIGLLAAGSYYVLAPIAGYSVMFAIWAFVWLALAVLAGRILRKPNRQTWNEVLARGVAAAIGCGVGFYLISGIWRPFNPKGWDYAVHFLSWTVAYLPGFAALIKRHD
jgi:thiamine transporter ThiT